VTDALDAAGLPTELGALDYLLHRGEAHPRTRSGIMAVEVLDNAPGWDRFVDTFENASRRVLRLRQKVVVPTWPTAALGDRSRFQSGLPRAAASGARTRHAA
jgi:hypothetical protein